MDGGGSSGTTTTSNEPSALVSPFLRAGLQASQSNILNNPTRFFPGETVAGFTPQTERALEAQEARALAGSPLLGASQDFTQQLLTDPGASPIFDAVVSAVRPGIDSGFAGGGRFGSGLHAESLGRGITRGLAPSINAAAERAPGLAREDFFDIGQLANVGGVRQGQEQRLIDADRERFEFGQNEPARRALQFMQSMSSVPAFGTSTGTSSRSDDKGAGQTLGTAAGLGLGAAGLFV